MQLQPGISVDSAFKTGSGRTVNFSIGYTLIYREYLNKAATLRDFENDVFGGVSVDWTDRFSMDMSAIFVHFFKAGADSNEDNALFMAADFPRFTFKVLDNLKFKLGFWMQFFEVLDSPVGISDLDPPGDLDDIRRGDITQDASGYNNFDSPYYTGTYLGDVASEEMFWGANTGIRAASSWSPVAGTSVGFDYKYVFEGYSNLQTAEWRGHYIKPSISQKMPWPGGSLSVANELRLRKYKSALAKGSDVPRQRFRNRLSVSIGQTINDFMSFTFFYRWQMLGENKDDYSALPMAHWFYTGVDFSF